MTARAAKAAHVWNRDPHDWYVEPTAATTALLRVEHFVGPIWDPACGRGHIVQACWDANLQASGTDIVRRVGEEAPPWWTREFDFLAARAGSPAQPPHLPFPAWQATNIVTNPPYFRGRGTEQFIRRALEVARGKVAVFASLSFLAGSGRAKGLWKELPPHRVWIITPRPSCPPGGVLEAGAKAEGDTKDYVWLVWDLTAPPAVDPVLKFIRASEAA